MRVLIIEDEVMAAERLQEMILEVIPDAEILGNPDSISSAVRWFAENETPDLAFFDIQLADGLSFEIFEQADVGCPVIFTTAFDEYALKAFKVNSIDYLLKPIDHGELKAAIEKYRSIHAGADIEKHSLSPQNIDNVLKLLTRQYKSRFVVKVGERIRSIPTEEIPCFYSMSKASYLQTTEDRHYVMDHSLEQVEALVNPERYFRVNRKFIIALDAIADIISYSNSRLKVTLKLPTEEDIIVSREKVKEFRKWLDR
ncbi:MAG: DNA-binding response regulator [Bacteroidetes bacterium]|nr:MAG: DNA-binding response regulator [Bacteroidota bacterium]